MVVLRNPVKTAVIANIGMIQTSTLPDAPRPNALTSVTVIMPPSMNTSPCAKLISSRMP